MADSSKRLPDMSSASLPAGKRQRVDADAVKEELLDGLRALQRHAQHADATQLQAMLSIVNGMKMLCSSSSVVSIATPARSARAHLQAVASLPQPTFSPEKAAALEAAWRSCINCIMRLLDGEALKPDAFSQWRKDLTEQLASTKTLKEAGNANVLVVGPSGAGKSKLLSVLVGEQHLLPSAGAGTAVTSAPIELRATAAPSDGNKSYKVHFEAFTVDEYKATHKQMTQALALYWEDLNYVRLPKKKPGMEPEAADARAAHDYLSAVFGKDVFKEDSWWQSKDTFLAAVAGLPDGLRQLGMMTREFSSGQEVAKLLQDTLVQSNSGRPQLWPLVKKACVAGHWPGWEGMSLIDLPGSGDVCSIRSRVAERYYSSASLVVVASRIERAATCQQAISWLARVVRDLPAGSAFYACTKADDVAEAEVIGSQGLAQGTSRMDAALARNSKVKSDVYAAVPGLREHKRVYTVSAKDMQTHMGDSAAVAVAPVFSSAEATEIPQLAVDIQDCLRLQRAKEQLQIMDRIDATIHIMDSQLTERPDNVFDAKKCESELARSVVALQDKLKNTAKEFNRASSSMAADLHKATASAAETGVCHLPCKSRLWGSGTSLHWRRHKSVIDHDGSWQGMDMSVDLSHPVVQELDGHWVDSFEKLPRDLVAAQARILDETRLCMHEFAGTFSFVAEVRDHVLRLGNSQMGGIKARLAQLAHQSSQALLEQRRGYAEDVGERIKGQLSEALQPAKACSGPGSFMERKSAVTRDVAALDLPASVQTVGQRVDRAHEAFKQCVEKMVEESGKQFRECYQNLWQQHGSKSEQARKMKAELLSEVRSELPGLERAFASIQALRTDVQP
eukprot:TRINITY_DN14256_c0_g1_i1.p1 TRINITY_DN14256_c0_g1~~TRINITY_DN14256_c0_g1_i1.p1  ORF type:complete len:848 (+),score=230.34 TRINITY_DN14256_c0_g1_i1:51-2594(+)